MRVCVYTKLHPVTAISGALSGFHFLQAIDDEFYLDVLRSLWRRHENLVVLEHDNLAWGVSALERCPHPWCVRPYSYGGRWLAQNLGLVKFSGVLTASTSRIWDVVERSGGRWDQLDGPLASALRERGYYAHVHARTWHAK